MRIVISAGFAGVLIIAGIGAWFGVPGISKGLDAGKSSVQSWSLYHFVPTVEGVPDFSFSYPSNLGMVTVRRPWKSVQEIDIAAGNSSAPALRIVVGVDSKGASETFSDWIKSTFRPNTSRILFNVDGREAFGQIDPDGLSTYAIDLGQRVMSLLIGGDTDVINREVRGQSVADQIVLSIRIVQ